MEKIQFSIEIQGTDEEISQLNKLSAEVDYLAESQKRLRKENKENTAEYRNQEIQLKETRKAVGLLQSSIEKENRVIVENKNTLRSVSAQLSILKDNLKDAEIGSESFKNITSEIKRLEGIQREANVEMGRGKYFVAEYGEALKDSFGEIADVANSINGLRKTLKELKNTSLGGKTEEEIRNLNKAIGQTQEQIIQLTNQQKAFGAEAAGNFGAMKRELFALRNISFAGKTDEEIKQINKRIGELMDSMSDLKAQQASFGVEFGASIAGSLKFVSAGVEGLVGSMELLGVGAESAEKAQKSLMSLIAVTQALGEIEDVLQKKTLQVTAAKIKDMVVTAKDTIAKKLNIAATMEAVKGGNMFAKALTLATSPIGLLVAGVAALGAGIYFLTRNYSGLSKEQELNNEITKEATKAVVEEQVQMDLLALQISKTEKGTQSYKDLIDKFNESYGKSIGLTLDYTASQQDLAIAFDLATEALMRKAKAEAIYNQIVELQKEIVDRQIEKQEALSGNMLQTASGLLDAFTGTASEAAGFESSIGDLNEKLEMLKNLYTENTETQFSFRSEAQKVNQQIRDNIFGYDGETEAVEKNTKATKNNNDENKKFLDLLKNKMPLHEQSKTLYEQETEALKKKNEELAKEDEYLKTRFETTKNEMVMRGQIVDQNQEQLDQKEIDRLKRHEEAKILIKEKGFDIVNQMAAGASQIVGNLRDMELMKTEGMLEQGLISEEEAAAKKKQIQKKYAGFDLAATIGKIIADTAAGVMNVWKTFAAVPPVAIALSTIVGGVGLTQLGIANQQYQNIKKMKRGGRLIGASHDNGGIYMGGGVEAEGGEVIVNKRSSALFLPILSAINSFNGFGKTLKMASGGVMPPSAPIFAMSGGGQISNFDMNSFARTIIDGINDKQVVVSEQEITSAQEKTTKTRIKTTF